MNNFYRKFRRAYDAFTKFMPWAWIGSFVVLVPLGVSGIDKKLGFDAWLPLGIILPTLFVLWLGFNGFGIVFKLGTTLVNEKKRPRKAASWVIYLGFLSTGILFFYYFLIFTNIAYKKLANQSFQRTGHTAARR